MSGQATSTEGSSFRAISSVPADIAEVVLALLLLVSFISACVLYLRFSYGIYPDILFDSDDSSALLFSNEVLHAHTFFPDWTTSTGIWVPFVYPLITVLPALLAVSNDWMTAYRTGVAIDQFLFLLLVWAVLGRSGMSRVMRVVLLTFLFASPSLDYARQTVLIGGKNWIYADLLTLAYLAFRCLAVSDGNERPRGKAVARFLALGLVGTALFIDRSYISQMLPHVLIASAAVCLSRLGGRAAHGIRNWLGVLGVLLASAALGQILFALFISGRSSYHPIAPRFVDLQTAANNIQLLVRGLLEWFGAAPPPGEAIYSLAAIASAVKLAVLVTIFMLPLRIALRWNQLRDEFLRLLVALFLTDLALRLFVYVFTDVNQNSTETIRYFVPVSLFGLTVCLRYAELEWRPLFTRSAALVAALVFLQSSSFAIAHQGVTSWQQGLVAVFDQAKLEHGYATWEYADQLTAVSNNRVKVRPISFLNGGFVPLHWLSSYSWFDGDAKAASSFLLLKGEQRNTDLRAYEGVLGPPSQVRDIGDFRMLVYPFDIAWHLGWRFEMTKPLAAPEMRATLESSGSPTISADGNVWVAQIKITNLGNAPFGTTGPLPVQLGTHLLGPNGDMLNHDLNRICLPVIQPGQSVQVAVALPVKRIVGNVVEFDLVQEGVAWAGERGEKTLRLSAHE